MSEPPSPHNRTWAAYAVGRTEAVIGLSIAVGIVCLVVSTIYLYSLVGPVDLQDVGQFVGL